MPEINHVVEQSKTVESGMNNTEFVEQYQSLKGSYFGIGVLFHE